MVFAGLCALHARLVPDDLRGVAVSALACTLVAALSAGLTALRPKWSKGAHVVTWAVIALAFATWIFAHRAAPHATFERAAIDAFRTALPWSLALPAALAASHVALRRGARSATLVAALATHAALSVLVMGAWPDVVRGSAAYCAISLIAWLCASFAAARPTRAALAVSAACAASFARDASHHRTEDLSPWLGEATARAAHAAGNRAAEITSRPVVVPGVPPRLAGKPTTLDGLRFEGWHYASEDGARIEAPDSRDIYIYAYYTVIAPVEGWCTFVHADRSPQRVNHENAAFTPAMATWKPGQVIASRHLLHWPVFTPAGDYQLWFGVGRLPCQDDTRMRVTSGDHDDHDRIRGGLVHVP